MTEKFRLSATPTVAERLIGVVAGAIFVVVGLAFAALPLIADGWLRNLTASSCETPPELGDCTGPAAPGLPVSGLGPIRFVGLIGIPFALIGIYLIVRVLRTAAWLEGTALTVRRAVTARQANLATAEVSIEPVTRRTTDDGRPTIRQIPTLMVREVGTKTPIQLPLTLPTAELRALADAIGTGRALDDRDREATRVADQLRAVADNPLTHRLT